VVVISTDTVVVCIGTSTIVSVTDICFCDNSFFACEYSHLYGELKTVIQKSRISTLITMDFLKSLYGYAMESWTRGRYVKETVY